MSSPASQARGRRMRIIGVVLLLAALVMGWLLLPDRRLLWTTKVPAVMNTIAFRPDGEVIAVGGRGTPDYAQ
ncbi:MAG: hypothetical protein MUD01_05655 [Chloroflexaceae bacterium]|nr:hypothetical protein [Chloroflexaceae bacterium]